MREIAVRATREGDAELWRPLFQGYCRFYEQPCDEAKLGAVWGWLMDTDHMLRGMVAEDARGSLLGLAHYHAWPSTLAGRDVCYLSDLFVAPEGRGERIGKRLYLEVLEECRRRGWPALELLTQKSNAIGRALYGQYGEASDFLLYVSQVSR